MVKTYNILLLFLEWHPFPAMIQVAAQEKIYIDGRHIDWIFNPPTHLIPTPRVFHCSIFAAQLFVTQFLSLLNKANKTCRKFFIDENKFIFVIFIFSFVHFK